MIGFVGRASSALAVVFGLACVPQAVAAPAPMVLDQYWGGSDSLTGYQDVIGNPVNNSIFETYGADVVRSGDSLSITFYTQYIPAYMTNSSALLGTNVGSLFLGWGDNMTPNTDGAAASDNTATTNAAPTYARDIYINGSGQGDPDRFSYVFDYGTGADAPAAGSGPDSGNGTLYNLDTNGGGVSAAEAQANVQTSFASGGFRQFQPVDVKAGANLPTLATGSWSMGTTSAVNVRGDSAGDLTGFITFTITDFFKAVTPPSVQSSLVFLWAMTCANDVMMASVRIPGGNLPVPLPAGIVFMVTGLLGLGILRRFRPAAGSA